MAEDDPELTRLRDVLALLAEEHLGRMATVPWADYADAIGRGKAGETFGCEVEGRYFDVGDQASWLDQPGGVVRLVAHAATDSEGGQALRVEREAIIQSEAPAGSRLSPGKG